MNGLENSTEVSSWVAGWMAHWMNWMGAMAWQVVVLAVLIAVADRVLRGRMSAQLRHGLWLLIGLKLMLPPTLPAWWRVAHEMPPEAGSAVAATSGLTPDLTAGQTFGLALWALWLLGVVLLGAREILARRRLRTRLFAASVPATPALNQLAEGAARRLGWAARRRMPALRIGGVNSAQSISGPLVIGCWRPLIVLPTGSIESEDTEWSTDDLENALAHELAHIRRGDLWLEALFAALAVIYWFHPAIHLARRRAHDLRELCCDATVAARLGPGYRRSLVRMAAHALLPRERAGAMAFVGSGSRIMARLDALERTRARGRRQRLTVAAILGLAAWIALPMAPRVHSRETDSDLAAARALAERMVTGRQSDPTHTGSMHVRWAVMQLNQQESARQAGGSKEE